MNAALDARQIERLAPAQAGVFSRSDLETCLDEKHPAALHRRLDRLLEAGFLRRYVQGFYVADGFDLAVLAQRIAPDSTLSFEAVLARELVIGPRPVHALSSIRSRRTVRFEACGTRLDFHHLADSLRFGERTVQGLRQTEPEKALLDVFTFHLRGRKALFDLHGDLDLDRLDREKLRAYLDRYANPRLVAFIRATLRLR